MNCYVLYCQRFKIENLCHTFNTKKGIEAFIPLMEKHIHSTNEIVLKPLFPNYLFIKTKNQIEFDTFLLLMKEEKNGVIKELKKDDVQLLQKMKYIY